MHNLGLEKFHTEYGKCAATVPLFAETFNKEVSNVLCEKTYHCCGIIARVENCCQDIDSEDGKRTVCKICARKTVNCKSLTQMLGYYLAKVTAKSLSLTRKNIAKKSFAGQEISPPDNDVSLNHLYEPSISFS